MGSAVSSTEAIDKCNSVFYPTNTIPVNRVNCTSYPFLPTPANSTDFCSTIQPNSLYSYSETSLQLSCTGALDSTYYACFDFSILTFLAGELSTGNSTAVSTIIVSIILALVFILPSVFTIMVAVLRNEVKRGDGHLVHLEHMKSSMHVLSATNKDELQVYLSYHHLEYSVDMDKARQKELVAANQGNKPARRGWNKKVIIKGITGYFEPGSLTAIMGPSGCGKSTLLDILADRKHGGYTTGKVLLNGRARGIFFKRLTGYVMQFDALFPYLTVREILRYTAEMRLTGLCKDDKDKAVALVIKELDLKRCADSRVGGNGVPGISGGQARRVTVGIELVTRPRVLFLDEPTTGLDSYSSLQLVRTLRLLADTGRTVMCTIHQPRPDIFRLFDNLVLMKEGCLAYHGKVSNIEEYLNKINIKIPQGASVADFIVDLTYARPSEDGEDHVATLTKAYEVSSLRENIRSFALSLENKTLENLPLPATSLFTDKYDKETGSPLDRRESKRLKFSQPVHLQIFTLIRRSYSNMFRDRNYFTNVAIQMCQFLFYGLLFLGVRLDPNEIVSTEYSPEQAVLNLQDNYWFINEPGITKVFIMRGFLFQVMMTIMLIEFVVIGNAFLEKTIFRREHASGAYSVVAYHFQYIIRFYVDAMWKALLASILCYFFPLTPAAAPEFFFFFALLAVASTMGSGMAFFMVSLVPDAEGAANIYSILIGTFGVYSGFFLFPNMFPVFMQWLYYLLPFKYSYEALVWNNFGDCMTIHERDSLFNLDATLNQWTNLIIFMLWPIALHGAAMLGSFVHTRPKSYWVSKVPCLFSKDNFESLEDEDDLHPSPAVNTQPAVNNNDVEASIEMAKMDTSDVVTV